MTFTRRSFSPAKSSSVPVRSSRCRTKTTRCSLVISSREPRWASPSAIASARSRWRSAASAHNSALWASISAWRPLSCVRYSSTRSSILRSTLSITDPRRSPIRCLPSYSISDPDRPAPPVDGEVGEALGGAPRRTPSAPGHEDQLPHAQGVLSTVGLDEPGSRHAHEDDVRLVVDVLPYAPPNAEAHHVGVRVGARSQAPDPPLPRSGGGGHRSEIRPKRARHGVVLLERPPLARRCGKRRRPGPPRRGVPR